jgi:hypothetical protein
MSSRKEELFELINYARGRASSAAPTDGGESSEDSDYWYDKIAEYAGELEEITGQPADTFM